MAKTKTFGTMDIYLSAFLSLHNLETTLEIRNGKVVFTFESTDALYRLMNDFNSNDDVPVADFTTQIKVLRGRMISEKENMNGKGNGYGKKENKL